MINRPTQESLNVHELFGTALDRYVAEVINLNTYFDEKQQKLMYSANPNVPDRQWSPTKFWSQAGPLLEQMKIDLNWEWEEAGMWTASIEPDINTRGQTILEAAMRAIVATQYPQKLEVGQEIKQKIVENNRSV